MKDKFSQLTQKFQNLPNWQKAFFISTALMLALVLGFFSLSLFSNPTTISTPLLKTIPILTKQEARVIPNPLNGLMYTRSEADIWQSHLPVGVMIENLPEVRPQSGLSKADVIYESLTEGGITRFLGIFLAEEASEIGPARSARPHFIDWAQEVGALYAHVGGSPQALDKLIDDSVKTLPEERPYYFRKQDSLLGPEHTAFTSSRGLWEMADNRGFKGKPAIQDWEFKEDATSSARPPTFSLRLEFSPLKEFAVRWDYDPETNSYKRFVGTPPTSHKDKLTDQQIIAKNVIVHYAKHTPLKDEKGRIDVQTVGTGQAKIFFDGEVKEATWKKPSSSERTFYYDSDGNEMIFNRGKIWVEVVPIGSPVKYS